MRTQKTAPHSSGVMRNNLMNKKSLIWIIATVTLVPSLDSLLRDYRGIVHYFEWLINGEIPNEIMPLWLTIGTFFIYAVLLLRPISAYGLFRLSKWGKPLAIGTLILDFTIRLAGFINAWTYYYRNPEARKMLEEVEKQIASGQVQAIQYSMIPSYIIAATCVVSVVILLKIDFREFQQSTA